jgi:hypothetical protein
MVRNMPYLSNTDTRGFILSSNRLKDEAANRGMQQNIFVAPEADNQTIAHETEHLLARQATGFPTSTREKFRELAGGYGATDAFLAGLEKSAPYLEEKYGIKNAYMDPKFIRNLGQRGLYEILATLGGAESALGVDLTKDPELRKTLFKDKNIREAYNAVTGLRQTRLDARDLPPYTRVPEPEESTATKLKKLLGFANGGPVPNAGNSKLI